MICPTLWPRGWSALIGSPFRIISCKDYVPKDVTVLWKVTNVLSTPSSITFWTRIHSHEHILKMYPSGIPPPQKLHSPITAFSHPTFISTTLNLIHPLILIFTFIQDSSLQSLAHFCIVAASSQLDFLPYPLWGRKGYIFGQIVGLCRITRNSQMILTSPRLGHGPPECFLGLRPEYSHLPDMSHFRWCSAVLPTTTSAQSQSKYFYSGPRLSSWAKATPLPLKNSGDANESYHNFKMLFLSVMEIYNSWTWWVTTLFFPQ